MGTVARLIMQGGQSAGTAVAITGGSQTLAGAGTTQGTATAINVGHADFTTVGSGSGGVLAAGSPGDEVTVYNAGANALAVYPPSGAKINNGATNGSVSCPTNTMMLFKCVSATVWRAMLSA